MTTPRTTGAIITQVAGLQLSNNTFSASPPGSMLRATNCVISQKGVCQPRNGQDRASTLPAAADLPFQLIEFQQNIIANYGLTKTSTSMGLGYVNSGAISAYSGGPYNPVGDNGVATDYARLHPVLASLFLHFACAAGPKVLETYNGTPRTSGMSRMPNLGADGSAFAPGPLPYDSSIAYVSVRKVTSPTSGVARQSPPSDRFVLSNKWVIPAGGLVRTGGNFVTVTVTPGAKIYKDNSAIQLPFSGGSTFTLSPGEANFPAGTYTVDTITDNVFTFTSVGANVASTVVEECNPGAIIPIVRAYLPLDAVAGDTIQWYRSQPTSHANIDPSPDVYLCGEAVLSPTNISNGYVVYVDTTPSSVLFDPLYTNPSDGDGGGASGANFQPPIYGDASNFDSKVWYANTTGQPRLGLQMLGVGVPNGVQNNDTLTVTDGTTTKVFTFKDSPAAATDVQIVSDGTPSFNIAWTTYFLITTAMTQLRSHGICAYGRTAQDGFPGGISFERTDWGAQLTVTASRIGSWSPAIPTGVKSSTNLQPNGLWYSKLQQPEAVPPVNFMNVGSANYYVRRIFGLRNALIILKEGDGIWSLTGSGSRYSLLQISTANIIAPDCACVFADSVWAYTDQGILRISDTGGTQAVSRPIETELNALATALPTQTYAWSFAVPYETERRVLFFIPFEAASTENGGAPLLKAYAYSMATNAWTGPLAFDGGAISGLVSTSHRQWLGLFDNTFATGRITEERKGGTYLDIADAAWSNTLTTTSDPLVVSLATAGAIQKGSGISQAIGGTTYRTKVSEVLGGGLYQVAELVPWVSGACTIYNPYEVDAAFLPEGSPGARRVLTRLFTLYKPASFSNLFGDATVETDQIQDELPIPTPAPGFGFTPFGTGSFGNPSPMVVDSNPIDAKWVNAGQFFPGFKLNEVWCQMKLQGVGMHLDTAEAPAGRGK